MGEIEQEARRFREAVGSVVEARTGDAAGFVVRPGSRRRSPSPVRERRVSLDVLQVRRSYGIERADRRRSGHPRGCPLRRRSARSIP